MSSPYFTRKRSRFFHDTAAPAHQQDATVPAVPQEPEASPDQVEEPVVGSACSSCGIGTLAARNGRYGPFLGCSEFPKCRHTNKLVTEDSAKRTRQTPRSRARLEIETSSTIRVWSTDSAAQQAVLGKVLAEHVTLARLDTAPRQDWQPAAAQVRCTAVFSLGDHDELHRQLQSSTESGGSGQTGAVASALRVQPVPSGALAFFRGLPDTADESTSDHTRAQELLARMPPRLYRTLLGFQRRGVETLLRWHGRGLLADEMGLGKTRQAIGLLGALRPWPVLIVVPASLRLMWADELESWLPELLAPGDVRLIASSSDALHQDEATPKVVLTSFRLATLLQASFQARTWKALIVDESHTLGSTSRATDSQQTLSLIHI